MMKSTPSHRGILQRLAREAMLDRGLLTDFSSEAFAELAEIHTPAVVKGGFCNSVRDLRGLLWASIDNDDSRDLDQLTVAESLSGGAVKILVAVADVDALVSQGSAIDRDAGHNTTSVYTAALMFPMLPEKLSTNLTSLNPHQDRLAIVIEMVIGADGSLQSSDVYRAQVRNHAQLAYNSVAGWLEANGPMPEAMAAVEGLAQNLRLQDSVAQKIRLLRRLNGALSLETIEARPIFDGDEIRSLEARERNRATEIIEDFMIAANGVTARYLAYRNLPSIRRVVRTPARWERIVALAKEYGFRLSPEPDSAALDEFLIKRKALDPVQFPDLSLSVIKLLGSGEYVAENPDNEAPGHFGLAVQDYAHSTAPNRRYPDLLTQRLLKAAIEGQAAPYTYEELGVLALHCTDVEDTVNKVERQIGKSAAALLLESRIGEQFDAIITGASPKGTWARLLTIPAEGKVIQGFKGLDVGDHVRLQLKAVNIEKGFIDFKRATKR